MNRKVLRPRSSYEQQLCQQPRCVAKQCHGTQANRINVNRDLKVDQNNLTRRLRHSILLSHHATISKLLGFEAGEEHCRMECVCPIATLLCEYINTPCGHYDNAINSAMSLERASPKSQLWGCMLSPSTTPHADCSPYH